MDEPRPEDLPMEDPRLRDPRYQARLRQGLQYQDPFRPDPPPAGAPPQHDQPDPGRHAQQAAPQSAPQAAPDPQARWHDPHGGTYHPAYDPGYSALDQAVDVPHRPSPGPGYLPVDPVSRGYQDPHGPQPAHGWAPPGAPPATPMPQAPPRMPRNVHPQAEHDDVSRLPPWLRRTAALVSAGAASAAATGRAGIAGLRARRSEKARERARLEAARAADAVDSGIDAQGPGSPANSGMRPTRQPGQKLTAKERRWQRRRRRHVAEEIAGWILVPIILIALYFALIGGLALFGLTLEDLMDALRTIRAQFS
ncbi:hypothetical protein [Saliniramus sp.]|uniref:hypothetical protein n=1 Tax=Saliniramus sp. TaxID=2986772 RepID=UPI002C5FDA41|nr:hypothetical protein [Saliniramus sp.]HMB09249.1 hypothetical protein [Saliniramus sp.]